MKHLENIFNALKGGLLTLSLVLSQAVWAQPYAPVGSNSGTVAVEDENKEKASDTNATGQPDLFAQRMDSVEISLLTCQPHDEIYSLYGHTAIRYHELWPKGIDVAFNYGVFDFRKPFFIGRFVLGWTDYELGAYPYTLFKEEYRRFGRMVTEQVLNLTTEEKLRLKNALADNHQDGNRIYRYNYFYSNCTTKARDIIEQCISGKLIYEPRDNYQPTYREMIHEMTKRHPWAAFGNDMLLGIRSDIKTDQRQQEFLPNNLMYDFDHARIFANGEYRPLVKERRVAVPAGVQLLKSEFPLSPTACAIIISLLALALFVVQCRVHKILLAWEILLVAIQSIIGLLLFVMLFSEHPTTTLNLQILLFNPIPLFFLYKVVRGKKTIYWNIALVLVIFFLIGGIWQDYAEGIWSLALCLLLQSIVHIKNNNKVPEQRQQKPAK